MTYLSMYRGDDRVLTITATEDLSGSEVRFTARRTRRAEEAVIEKVSPGDITIDEFSAAIAIDAADTEDLDREALFWDIEITDSADKIRTVATGRLAILPDITRQ